MDSLRTKILKGDTTAYNEARKIYFLSGYQNEFFYYSFFMASNYNYNKAKVDMNWSVGDWNLKYSDQPTKAFINNFKKDSVE